MEAGQNGTDVPRGAQATASEPGLRLRDELARLVDVVSHDMSEPVQVMAGCARLLDMRYSGRLGEDADRLLGAIDRSAKRLQAMIDAFVDYSNIDRRRLEPAPVDCARALRDACARLAAPIRASGAQITADQLPVLAGEERQIERVFVNLIDNALRFHSDWPPRVRVSCIDEGGRWRVTVADNGRGIAAAEHEQIFELFQPANARDDGGATPGVGLAVCRKIVERHGGRIWVEPRPDDGSVFRFTLRRVEPATD
jgi:signal transduction histidine kinase